MLIGGEGIKTILGGSEIERKIRKAAEKWPICCKDDKDADRSVKGDSKRKDAGKNAGRRGCCPRRKPEVEEMSAPKKEQPTKTHSISQLKRDISYEIG